MHYLFSWPDGQCKPCRSPGPGLDIKGDGGYIVAAPSLHPDTGRQYTWLEEAHPLRLSPVPAPPWLLDLVCDRKRAAPTAASPDEWYQLVSAGAEPGTRNSSLARLAGMLYRRLPAPVAYELARVWAVSRLHPPLAAREIDRTLSSIARSELRRRGGEA